MYWEIIPHGQPIPNKKWLYATDVLVDYLCSGEEWISAGKPKTGILYEKFCGCETEYNQMVDAIWFAKWSEDQRSEWQRIHDNIQGGKTNNG